MEEFGSLSRIKLLGYLIETCLDRGLSRHSTEDWSQIQLAGAALPRDTHEIASIARLPSARDSWTMTSIDLVM